MAEQKKKKEKSSNDGFALTSKTTVKTYQNSRGVKRVVRETTTAPKAKQQQPTKQQTAPAKKQQAAKQQTTSAKKQQAAKQQTTSAKKQQTAKTGGKK